MNSDVCEQLIHFLDAEGELDCENAPEEVKKWLEPLSLPMTLLRFMQCDWPQADCQLAAISIHSSQTMYDDSFTPILVKFGFLNIGSGPNGDLLLIDFTRRDCVPGFIPLSEWDQKSDPEHFFQPIARSLAGFLYRVAEKRYLPCDYYAAKAFNQFLIEERAI